MLTDLTVKNFILIEEIRVSFRSGFTAISGETGAGKSLLLGAVGLLLGGKASPQLIRTDQKEAIIEAVFDISKTKKVTRLLEEKGMESDETLIVRRHLLADGKNKIYANGRQITLAELSELTRELIDLTGQHSQQILLDSKNFLPLLDDSIALISESARQKHVQGLLEYSNDYNRWMALQKEIASLEEKAREKERLLDRIDFELKEIKKANLKDPQYEDELLAEKGRVKNAGVLLELSQNVERLLTEGENSLSAKLRSLRGKMEKALSLDPSMAAGMELLEKIKELSLDAGSFFARYATGISEDPSRLDEIESVLFTLSQLKRKYGPELKDVLAYGEKLESDRENLLSNEAILETKNQEKKNLEKSLWAKGLSLSTQRREAALVLEKKIQKELRDLSMPQVVFKVRVDSPSKEDLSTLTRMGFDEVDFEISANPGEKPRPLSEIASGGELSRILLAIKGCLPGRFQPTAVFDEIDAGIGGAVAHVVGVKLKAMAKNKQVLVVTHLPQIAALADHHLILQKEVVAKKTQTRLIPLNSMDERQEEISRMLGGATITEKTRQHAREMLREA